jgi:hypothetical protein
MMRLCRTIWGLALALSVTLLGSAPAFAQDKPSPKPATNPTDLDLADILRARSSSMGGGGGSNLNDPKHYRDFNELTQGATKHEGLFTLHQKDDHVYAEIKPFQFDQPLYSTAMIARGLARAGEPLSDPNDPLLLVFHRAGDKVQLIARNFFFKAPPGSPMEKAVKQNYTDSIIMSMSIVAINPSGGMSVVVDLNEIYFTDFAKVGLGFLDRSRTNWFKVKAFANNLELEVQATFSGGGRGSAADGVSDSRGLTMVIHYSLLRLPDSSYRPRAADDRLGHFLCALKDFGSTDPDTNFIRLINRWRLEKADPRAKLSPPKKQMVWWVEDTVPIEYRPYIEAGILEWNKAFEKVGIRNAIAVRWQSERDDFDPEDVNYCTIRWITTNRTYAMSCFRANPLTGEILDGDVIFDASWVKAWKKEYALLTGTGPIAADAHDNGPLAIGEIVSPILADKMGYGQFLGNRSRDPQMKGLEVVPADWGPLQVQLQRRLSQQSQHMCQLTSGMHSELSLAAVAFADAPGAAAEPKLPEEFIGQLIKEVVMHEVGHSLGLRHNFKASSMLTAEQLNDTAITHVKGQAGSVMDYNPINLAARGQKQGDYVTQTLGPYDYWAIEYAYKEIMGDEAAELKKIASRSTEPDLVFSEDYDRMMNNDPLVNTYDLGSDNIRFAKDRLILSEGLLKDLDSKVVKDGEPWARLRIAFSSLLRQYGNSATLVSQYIGGQSISRDHKGDKGARDPIVPVSGAKQREALAILNEHILSDRAFRFSPALLRRLSSERWMHWGTRPDGVEISVYDRILGIQRVALSHALSGDVLTRVQEQELQSEPGSNPLKLSEVFKTISDGVFTELNVDPKAKPAPLTVSTVRRNLQREYVSRLSGIVLGPKSASLSGSIVFAIFGGGGDVPADARALARLHLRELGAKITKALNAGVADDTTRAHLEETQHRIEKVLGANLSVNEP